MVRPTGAACFPIWSCSRWGLPCRGCCHPRGALLPHHFTLAGAACAALRRYLSVALSVGSRPPGVTWHRALWSPDFPPSSPACADEDSDCLADSWGAPYADMAMNARWIESGPLGPPPMGACGVCYGILPPD